MEREPQFPAIENLQDRKAKIDKALGRLGSIYQTVGTPDFPSHVAALPQATDYDLTKTTGSLTRDVKRAIGVAQIKERIRDQIEPRLQQHNQEIGEQIIQQARAVLPNLQAERKEQEKDLDKVEHLVERGFLEEIWRERAENLVLESRTRESFLQSLIPQPAEEQQILLPEVVSMTYREDFGLTPLQQEVFDLLQAEAYRPRSLLDIAQILYQEQIQGGLDVKLVNYRVGQLIVGLRAKLLKDGRWRLAKIRLPGAFAGYYLERILEAAEQPTPVSTPTLVQPEVSEVAIKKTERERRHRAIILPDGEIVETVGQRAKILELFVKEKILKENAQNNRQLWSLLGEEEFVKNPDAVSILINRVNNRDLKDTQWRIDKEDRAEQRRAKRGIQKFRIAYYYLEKKPAAGPAAESVELEPTPIQKVAPEAWGSIIFGKKVKSRSERLIDCLQARAGSADPAVSINELLELLYDEEIKAGTGPKLLEKRLKERRKEINQKLREQGFYIGATYKISTESGQGRRVIVGFYLSPTEQEKGMPEVKTEEAIADQYNKQRRLLALSHILENPFWTLDGIRADLGGVNKRGGVLSWQNIRLMINKTVLGLFNSKNMAVASLEEQQLRKMIQDQAGEEDSYLAPNLFIEEFNKRLRQLSGHPKPVPIPHLFEDVEEEVGIPKEVVPVSPEPEIIEKTPRAEEDIRTPLETGVLDYLVKELQGHDRIWKHLLHEHLGLLCYRETRMGTPVFKELTEKEVVNLFVSGIQKFYRERKQRAVLRDMDEEERTLSDQIEKMIENKMMRWGIENTEKGRKLFVRRVAGIIKHDYNR